MSLIHFLNVKQGDCSIIQHNSDRVTVIDVCNAKPETIEARIEEAVNKSFAKLSVLGNFNQKDYPVNPLLYMKDWGIGAVWRFILTHPDMDHMDGIEAFWNAYNPPNFWDTDNTCNKDDDFNDGSPYNYDDWAFYKELRAGKAPNGVNRFTLFSGSSGKYWNMSEDGNSGADGLHLLAPTPDLVREANDCDDFNDCSYALLYRTGKFRILFGGDSHDETWSHILVNHNAAVRDVDLLIAPHHGRKSNRDYTFLDVLRPKMTFFGNAPSQHLAYDAWNYRKLPFMTNNQAGCMVVYPNAADSSLDLYVTNEAFARARNASTFYSERCKGWYIQEISRAAKSN
jgi:beta-lactamase superfamily II metal-dependent hydrolase